ncbi:hypothetical protein HC762_00740 [bacterium]|nr:hypothetical protein [bacterium]
MIEDDVHPGARYVCERLVHRLLRRGFGGVAFVAGDIAVSADWVGRGSCCGNGRGEETDGYRSGEFDTGGVFAGLKFFQGSRGEWIRMDA